MILLGLPNFVPGLTTADQIGGVAHDEITRFWEQIDHHEEGNQQILHALQQNTVWERVVVEGIGEGEITSGGFSPTIGKSIALARVPAGDYEHAQVDVRGKLLKVWIVKVPFVRNGQIQIDIDGEIQ